MCAWRSKKEKIPYFEMQLCFPFFFWAEWNLLISLFRKVTLRQIKYEDPDQKALGFDKPDWVLCSLQHDNGWHWNEKDLDNE